MSIGAQYEEMITVAKQLGVVEYKTAFLIPAIQELLDQCAAVGLRLIQKHQDAPEGYEELWSNIRRLYDSL